MAEAVRAKSSKTQNSESHVDSESSSVVRHYQATELTDANLEKRLKSLTSFINNIEPTPKQGQIEETPSSPAPPLLEEESTQISKETSSRYYEMVSEKAAQKQSMSFGSLKQELDNLNETSSAPPLQVASAPPKHSFLNSIKSSLTYSFSSSTATLKPATGVFADAAAEQAIDFNLEKIKQVNKLNYPKLNWNRVASSKESTVADLDNDLMRFFELDTLCKELEVYYKCKQINSEQFGHAVQEFIQAHSNLVEFQYKPASLNHSKHELYRLLSDYYEARKLVLKCERHINRFKWNTIANRIKAIWSFEKYTIEAHGN